MKTDQTADKKNIIDLLTAEFAHRVVKVKIDFLLVDSHL